MSRKFWIVVISLGVLAVLVIAAGVAAFFLLPHIRSKHNITNARALAAEGDLLMARRHYQEYLAENPRDIAVLEEYIDTCEAVESDRRRALLVAGRAYTRLAQLEPENPQRKADVLDFYRSNQFWAELESAIELLYPGDLSDELAYDKALAVQLQGRTSVAEDEFEAYLGLDGGREGAPLKDAPLQLARIYSELGRARDIEPMFNTLREDYPEDGMLAVNYAGYLLDQDRTDEAATQLASVPEDTQGELDYLLMASRLAAVQGDNEQSLALIEKALEQEPDDVNVNLSYTMALERNGNRDKAVTHIEGMDPMYRLDTPGFMLLLLEMKLESSDLEGANAIREQYTEAYPDQRFLDEYLQGRIAFTRGANDSGGYEDARDHFVRALEMNPALDRARFFLAVTELELENLAGARIALEKYLDNNPTDGRARRVWDRYFGEAKSPVELEYAANQLLDEEQPEIDELIFTAQEILRNQIPNGGEKAIQLFEKAIAVDPSNPVGYNALASHYLDQKAIEDAETVMARAIESGLDPSAFPLLEASIKLSRSDIDGALEIARAELDGSQYATVETWATIFGRAGYVDQAGELLQGYIDGGGEAIADAYRLRVSLALRFASLDEAMSLLERAESDLAGDGDNQQILNGMRLAMVRALSIQDPIEMDTVNALLDKIEASNADHDGLVIARGRLALKKDLPDYPMITSTVGAIPASSPVYEDARLLLAEVAYRRGIYEDVVDLAQGVLDVSPRSTAALYFLGEGKHGLRLPEEARAAMEQILDIDRHDHRAMSKLVNIYAELGLSRLANDMLARYKEEVSRDSDTQGNVEELQAYLNRIQGEHAESADALRAKLESNPESFSAMSGLVQSLMAQGNTEEAIATVEQFLEVNPTSAEAWVLLGQSLLESGPNADLAKASTAFTRAQVIVPEHGLAQLGLVDVNIREGNFEIAASMCRRYLDKRPNDVNVLYRLASLLSRRPEGLAESLALVDRALELGGPADFLRLRALLLARLDRPEEAIADMERLRTASLSMTPDDELTLAEAYLALPDIDKAKDSLAAARAKNSEGDPRLTARADNIEARIGASEANQ